MDTTVLNTGEVGWVVCAIKDILGAPVGDTLTHQHNPASHVLPGFKKVKPRRFMLVYSLLALTIMKLSVMR